jgi:hypothetical protein
MRRVQSKQTIKLQLLALVLAIALIWYSLNPTPGPVIIRKKPADFPPDEKQNARPQNISVALSEALKLTEDAAKSLSSCNKDEEDDFDWPEFINA